MNSILKFIAELIGRLFSKNPTFFKVIQVISAIVALITGLPEYLAKAGIDLGPKLLGLENKAIAIAALVALFIAQLPKPDPTVEAKK
jgi:hypothetical protein